MGAEAGRSVRSPPVVEISSLDLKTALREVIEAAAASTPSKQALARLMVGGEGAQAHAPDPKSGLAPAGFLG